MLLFYLFLILMLFVVVNVCCLSSFRLVVGCLLPVVG